MDDNKKPAIHPVKFWTDFETDPDNPGKQRSVDWVSWVKIGDASGAITQNKIARLAPRTNRDGVEISAPEWAAIEPAYKAWKASEEPPTEGTALIAWPGCTKPLLVALKKLHIRTVEEFVEAPDHSFNGLPVPNMRYLRDQAEAFLLAQGDLSAVAEELAKRDTEIVELKDRLEAMDAEIKSLKAKSSNGNTKSSAAKSKPPAGQEPTNPVT